MNIKKWLWILIAVVLAIAIVITTISLTTCSKGADPRETSIVLTKDTNVGLGETHYNAKVSSGKNGKTYVFKSNKNEHEYSVYVLQIEGGEAIAPSNYELKMYDKDYKQISMTYNATNNTITLTDVGSTWNSTYEEEDVYFAITLKADISFKFELQKPLA